MPLDSIHSVQKRVQYTINLMNPKVRLEVKLFVDRHFKIANSKCAQPAPTSECCCLLTHPSLLITQLHETAGALSINLVCAAIVACLSLAVQSSATFKYLHLRCRGEAPDSFQEHLSAAMAAHRTLMEQQAIKQRQQQQQQAAGMSQQSQHSMQQQAAAPWPFSSGPVSHPISGTLTSGSFSGPVPPGALWVDTANQQQQSSGGGLPPRSPQAHISPLSGRGLQAVDGELLSQLVDMVRCCC
jgi:hypothetical protein